VTPWSGWRHWFLARRKQHDKYTLGAGLQASIGLRTLSFGDSLQGTPWRTNSGHMEQIHRWVVRKSSRPTVLHLAGTTADNTLDHKATSWRWKPQTKRWYCACWNMLSVLSIVLVTADQWRSHRDFLNWEPIEMMTLTDQSVVLFVLPTVSRAEASGR